MGPRVLYFGNVSAGAFSPMEHQVLIYEESFIPALPRTSWGSWPATLRELGNTPFRELSSVVLVAAL